MDKEKKVDNDLNVDADKTKENEDKGDNTKLKPETVLAQKKHFQEKTVKQEEEIEDLKAKLAEKESVEEVETKDVNIDTSSKLEDDVSLIKFSMKHSDLPTSIIEEAYKISKAEGITPEEVLEKPYMKLYIEDEARKGAIETASNTGNRSSIKTDKPIEEYSADEHEELYEKEVASKIRR